jgi:hypothetical protein
MFWMLVLFLTIVTSILAVNCSGCSTVFTTTVMWLTDIKILRVAAIAIILKDILSDYKMSVAMASSCFNLILDC